MVVRVRERRRETTVVDVDSDSLHVRELEPWEVVLQHMLDTPPEQRNRDGKHRFHSCGLQLCADRREVAVIQHATTYCLVPGQRFEQVDERAQVHQVSVLGIWVQMCIGRETHGDVDGLDPRLGGR